MIKKVFSFALFVLFFHNLFSQNDTLYYFDGYGRVADSVDAVYYRVIKNYKLNQETYKYIDYYITGEKRMVGMSLKKDILVKTGAFMSAYKNGQISDQSEWKDGKCIGISKTWYPNGVLMQISESTRSGLKIKQSWDSTGVQTSIDGNGVSHDLYNGVIVERFEIKNGKKDGKCWGYHNNGKLFYEEEFKEGDFIKGLLYDSSQIAHEYTIRWKTASFQGGDVNKFRDYVAANLTYPLNLARSGVGGMAIFQFAILPNGNISKVRLIKNSGFYQFDKMGYKALLNTPPWSPGIQRGEVVEQNFVIPIVFKMN